MNTQTQLSENLLRALALKQFNNEPFFILEGIELRAFEGTEDEESQNYGLYKVENATKVNEPLLSWYEWVCENLIEIKEYDHLDFNNDYLVLTDEEADEKAKEYILDSAWAFNKSFLDGESDIISEIDDKAWEAVTSRCESSNNAVLAMIEYKDSFVENAISADGRGHFMSSYDGNENAETISADITGGESVTFYIYRIN